MHASIHVVVQNQLALGVDVVSSTFDRLMCQGLDRHETIHAIGAVLAENIYSLLGLNVSLFLFGSLPVLYSYPFTSLGGRVDPRSPTETTSPDPSPILICE